MNKKLVRDYLVITFLIMIVFWVSCAVISQLMDLNVNHPLLRIMHIIGGFSPTIASYVSLKRHRYVHSFKNWLTKVFDIRQSTIVYATIALFVAIYYLLGCLINGFEIGAPVFMAIVLVPMMLVGGGNEEAGWRMILQPELEKQFGFHPAVLVTGLIWWIWHLPIFFIKGTANAEMNYFMFGIMCLALSYAMGTVQKLSKGVFPCILTHCLINGLSAIFVFSYGWMSCIITFAAMMLVSVILCNRIHVEKE